MHNFLTIWLSVLAFLHCIGGVSSRRVGIRVTGMIMFLFDLAALACVIGGL